MASPASITAPEFIVWDSSCCTWNLPFSYEVTEGWVYANRQQRMAIILAGVWVELICCALATIVFWGTAPGSGPHELAYKVMLITGIAVVVIEMMPLIKLDGYYLFCELVGISELKERSTAFSLAWIKRKIFRIPAEHEYVSPKRAWLYAAYAITSGAYSYLLLLAVVLFVYHVLRNYIPEWAFVPALFLVFLMFRSRLYKMAWLIKLVYLDKAEMIRSWFLSKRMIVTGVASAAILFVPFVHRVVEVGLIFSRCVARWFAQKYRERSCKFLSKKGRTSSRAGRSPACGILPWSRTPARRLPTLAWPVLTPLKRRCSMGRLWRLNTSAKAPPSAAGHSGMRWNTCIPSAPFPESS